MPKLLIVDDEIDIREFAKNFFSKRGVDVITANGGKKAIDLVRVEQPNLVLLDVRMEEMTGIETLRQLREVGHHVKVIMVSGVEDNDTVNEAKGLGVIGYIHKPLVLDKLEKIVLSELKA